jgi:hypothetical protein
MLGWLRRWWRERRRRQERLLYEYFDGSHFRFVDPWATYRALYGSPVFDIGMQLAAAVAGEEPEISKARECICAAFKCSPYDEATGQGLTDEELFALLDHFLDWTWGIQKKTNGLPTPLPNTVSTS